MEKESLYQARIRLYEGKLAVLDARARNISILRLVVFIMALVGIYAFAAKGSTPGIIITLAAGTFVFFFLVKFHSRILLERNLTRAMLSLNRSELDGLLGHATPYADGASFMSADHPYSGDLDIFGPGSLYHFINRSGTVAGRKRLGEILMHPFAAKEPIEAMQQAVADLTGLLEWRQHFLAIGIAYGEGEDDQLKIEAWSDSRPLFSRWIFRVLVVLIPLMTMTMIVLLSTGTATIQQFLLYLLIPLGVAGSYTKKVNNRHNNVSKTADMLQKHARLLREIETLEVGSELVRELQHSIRHRSMTASTSLKSLSAILTALDNRLNFVSWAFLNGLLLWDILQMMRLEAWQLRHRMDLRNWFKVIAEFDVICSFANFNFNYEGTVFPEPLSGSFEVTAKDAGHPLIDPKVRVSNDISIHKGEFLIITGANMAGKSTYLRTVGVSLVLAMCGAPVCAASFRFTPIQVYSSIRTRDSLRENESYFYAELKRLKAIIDEIRSGRKLFIILDEILKGTNSKDKHAGSEALLRQLIDHQATGIVATHDVSLGNMSEIFPENIRNHCFEVEIEGSQLHFDYRIRDGVSRNLNATLLMREMGITI